MFLIHGKHSIFTILNCKYNKNTVNTICSCKYNDNVVNTTSAVNTTIMM